MLITNLHIEICNSYWTILETSVVPALAVLFTIIYCTVAVMSYNMMI